jgi:hypothetical protein
MATGVGTQGVPLRYEYVIREELVKTSSLREAKDLLASKTRL